MYPVHKNLFGGSSDNIFFVRERELFFFSLKCEKFALAAEGSQRSSKSLGMVSNPRLAWPGQDH